MCISMRPIVKVKMIILLVSQGSSKMVLDVGIHDRPEVVESTVPEQVDDEDLNTDG